MYFAFAYQPIIDIDIEEMSRTNDGVNHRVIISYVPFMMLFGREESVERNGIIINPVGTIDELLEIRDSTSSKV